MLRETYSCSGCAAEFERLALAVIVHQGLQVRVCPRCRGPVEREEVRIVTPFWKQLAGAVIQPFVGWNLALVTAAMVLYTFVQIVPDGAAVVPILRLGSWLFKGVYAALFFRLTSSIAQGEDELLRAFKLGDQLPDWRALFYAFGQFVSCILISFAPAFFLGVLAPGPFGILATLLVALGGVAYFPAALACVAVTERILWNPFDPIRMALAVPGPYACLLLGLMVPGVVLFWSQWMAPHSLGLWLVQTALGGAATVVAARMIGLLVREYWDDVSG